MCFSFLPLFLTRPYGSISRWFLLSFSLSKEVYILSLLLLQHLVIRTPLSRVGDLVAYSSRMEEITWKWLRGEYIQLVPLGGFVSRAFLIHLNIRYCPLFHIPFLPLVKKKWEEKKSLDILSPVTQVSLDTENLHPDSVKWNGLVSSTIKSIFCLKLFKTRLFSPLISVWPTNLKLLKITCLTSQNQTYRVSPTPPREVGQLSAGTEERDLMFLFTLKLRTEYNVHATVHSISHEMNRWLWWEWSPGAMAPLLQWLDCTAFKDVSPSWSRKFKIYHDTLP